MIFMEYLNLHINNAWHFQFNLSSLKRGNHEHLSFDTEPAISGDVARGASLQVIKPAPPHRGPEPRHPGSVCFILILIVITVRQSRPTRGEENWKSAVALWRSMWDCLCAFILLATYTTFPNKTLFIVTVMRGNLIHRIIRSLKENKISYCDFNMQLITIGLNYHLELLNGAN